jgi:hypothetical protein
MKGGYPGFKAQSMLQTVIMMIDFPIHDYCKIDLMVIF